MCCCSWILCHLIEGTYLVKEAAILLKFLVEIGIQLAQWIQWKGHLEFFFFLFFLGFEYFLTIFTIFEA